jgi:uncharacterized protein involved in exopolysaccharide biosynthesis
MTTRPSDPLDEDDELTPPRPRPTPVDWVMLVLGAARRRKLFALVVFLAALCAPVAYYRSRTPTYRVEARIFAKRQAMLPGGVRPVVLDDPARSAWELVHRRENLLAIIEETKLLENSPWFPPGAPVEVGTPANDGRQPSREDRLSTLVVKLDQRLLVTAEEGIIAFRLDWPDPQQAYQILVAVLQNFFEARHVLEITEIDEIISVLEGRAVTLRGKLDEAVRASAEHGAAAVQPSERVVTPSRPSGPSAELVELKAMLDAKERAVHDVEENRRRRLSELQAQLDQARAVYSENHPTTASLRQQISAMSSESPQTVTLRQEEQRLRRQYTAKLAEETRLAKESAPRPPQRPPPAVAAGSLAQDERVREARMEYQQVLERVQTAQVELDAARAAFKHRYEVIWPAEIPKTPVSPNARKIFGGGVVAALLLALGLAALPDLLRRRVVQLWQLERGLELPVLAEIERE